MWEWGIMLAFWGNNEALSAAYCTNLSKRLRYSNRAVSNSNATVTKPLLLWYHNHKKAKYFETANN